MPGAPEMLQSLAAGVAHDTERWADIQNRYYQKQLELWSKFAAPAPDAKPPKVVEPDPGDRRFNSPEWQQPYFNFLAQSYLLNARMLNELVEGAQLEPHAKKKLTFFARQYIDALSPANFPWSNPEALKLAAETKGDSLTQGLRNLAADMDKGLVSMTDETAFEVGRNLAMSRGAVVYENDFIQLIQYSPTTESVYERPLVMVPPCINKYYILDLQPENSFVRHAVGEGPHGVHGVVAQHAGIDGQGDVGRLPDARRHARARRRAGDLRRRQSECARLLRRRNAARQRARGAPRAGRRARRESDAARDHARFLRHRRALGLHRRCLRAEARARFRARRRAARPRARAHLREPARERPHLAVRREQLSQGQDAAGIRSALLEQRQHQPAGGDVRLLHTQHVSRKQPAQAGQAQDVRRAGRSAQARHARLRAGDARGPHRAVENGVRERAAPAR